MEYFGKLGPMNESVAIQVKLSALDGDTVVDTQQVDVRLERIDCPELTQPFGQRAKEAASDLAFGCVPAVVEVELSGMRPLSLRHVGK